MKHQVFVSHSHIDAPLAQEVTAALEKRGIRCWIAPRDVPAGGSYADAILTALEGSRCVVLIYTDQCNTSAHVLREVERAVYIGGSIVPLRFDSSEVSKSLSYFLTSVRWLPVLSRPARDGIELAADSIAASLARPQEITPNGPAAFRPKAPRTISLRPQTIAIFGAAAFLGALVLFLLLRHKPSDREMTTIAVVTPVSASPSPAAVVVPAPNTETYRKDTASPVPSQASVVSPRAELQGATSSPAKFLPQLPGERYPETRTRLLSLAELQSWPVEKLRYAINEIFARNGASFPDKKIQGWFSQFAWFKPRTNMTFDQIESALSEIERQNVKILAEARQQKSTPARTVAGIWRGTIHEVTIPPGASFEMPCEFTFDEDRKEVSSLIQVDKHRGGSTFPYTLRGKTFYFSWAVPDDSSTATNLTLTPNEDGKTALVTSEVINRGRRVSTGSGTFSKVE